MDPAIEEAVRRGPADREIEAAALVAAGVPLPPDLRLVATFGEVVTGRVRVDRVAEVRRHPAIRSLKAARMVGPAEVRLAGEPVEAPPPPRGVADATGAGSVLAFLDWGCDFAHPSFRGEDGRTRLRAIWDQRGLGDGNRWGYGRVLVRERIDDALREPDPYAALGYHPGRRAAHGTHVMDIAAGKGMLPGTARGFAPEAELVFVHLAAGLRTGEGDLGDSVRILEALDFARAIAGRDPLVVNMSLGRTAGDHTGRSFVERGMDALLEEAPGRAIVQSAGNYFGKRLHAAGSLAPGQVHALQWLIEPGDRTSNELEIWYPGPDRLSVELVGPGGAGRVLLQLGQRGAVLVDGRLVGFAYHRENDPLNGDHHVDLFLEPEAPPGTWEVRLVGEDVVDGRWHAWIERDPAGPHSQSSFRADVATDDTTIGTIATGHRTLVVGAIDARTGLPAPFSSRGPCRDGRTKPDLAAYGVGIVAARSTPPGAVPGSGGQVEMSGTSMASPQVAGAVAALFGRAPRPLNIAETRLLVLGSARRLEGDPMRTGAGLLDTEAALAALQCMFKERKGAMSRQAGGEWEPRTSWSSVGTAEFEREMEEALGPMGAYDVVGWPGFALQPTRAGDILIRADPAGRGAVIARITDLELHAPDMFPAGAWAEGDGEGWYAETVERTPAGWASSPAFRLVANRNQVVRPGQIVLRPVAGAIRPQRAPSAAGGPRSLAPVTPMPVEEPNDPEPWPTGDDPADDREDTPKTPPARGGGVGAVCPWWMAGDRSGDYLQYAQPQTWGRVRLLINGHGAADKSEPFDMMQYAVETTNPGDAVYLASWMFDPATPLTRQSSTGITWGDLIMGKGRSGVTFRLILNDFNPISRWHSNLTGLDALVLALPPGQRDQIKYVLSRHPAHILVPDWVARLARIDAGDQSVGTHHQKFMVVRHGEHLTAFCGGVDIIPGMTPSCWQKPPRPPCKTSTPWRGWHDLQLQLEGPITRDLEKEFVWRWNRERTGSRRNPLPGWSPFEQLTLTPLSRSEQNLGFYPTAVQMLRTVSESTGDEPTAFFRTRRDDVRQAYRNGIACTHRFLYLENQYYRTPELADWIVARRAEQPELIVMIVVVDGAMAAADDGKNPITDHGFHLQHETFDRIVRGLGADRVRFYTMDRRYVHSKLILADDLWCCIGSANVNPRSFEVDSELNVQLREHDPGVILGLRKTLWAHNLGVSEATVGGWAPSEFFARWDAIAAANAAKRAAPGTMQGEGVLRFDYTRFPGRQQPIPDGLVDLGVSGDRIALDGDVPSAVLAGRSAQPPRPRRA